MRWAPTHVYNVHHMFSRLAGDNNCVGNKCSNIETELMRRGGRLPEWLIARERVFHQQKIDFAVQRDWQLFVNRQLSATAKLYLKLPARFLCMINYVCTSYS